MHPAAHITGEVKNANLQIGIIEKRQHHVVLKGVNRPAHLRMDLLHSIQ